MKTYRDLKIHTREMVQRHPENKQAINHIFAKADYEIHSKKRQAKTVDKIVSRAIAEIDRI